MQICKILSDSTDAVVLIGKQLEKSDYSWKEQTYPDCITCSAGLTSCCLWSTKNHMHWRNKNMLKTSPGNSLSLCRFFWNKRVHWKSKMHSDLRCRDSERNPSWMESSFHLQKMLTVAKSKEWSSRNCWHSFWCLRLDAGNTIFFLNKLLASWVSWSFYGKRKQYQSTK